MKDVWGILSYRTFKLSVLGSLSAVLVLLAVACSEKSDVPIVVVEAADFSFTLPDSIEGGLVRLQLTNTGQDPHHMQLLKLNVGVSQEQMSQVFQSIAEAMPTEGEAAMFRIFEAATLAGGPAGVGAGGKSDVTLNIAPGEYTLICLLVGADRIPHVNKGMVRALTVTAPDGDGPTSIEADVTVTLNDFAFTGAPTSLSAGETTIKVVNAGREPHEMGLLKLKGVTFGELRDRMTNASQGQRSPGPPPFDFAGGFQAIMPGEEGWATLDLTSGEYALICFVPSPAEDFTPHFAPGHDGVDHRRIASRSRFRLDWVERAGRDLHPFLPDAKCLR